jgi:hypothetical protein
MLKKENHNEQTKTKSKAALALQKGESWPGAGEGALI